MFWCCFGAAGRAESFWLRVHTWILAAGDSRSRSREGVIASSSTCQGILAVTGSSIAVEFELSEVQARTAQLNGIGHDPLILGEKVTPHISI